MRLRQGDCENTGLPNTCVDVILCCGMLHHLDLSYAFPEIRRAAGFSRSRRLATTR